MIVSPQSSVVSSISRTQVRPTLFTKLWRIVLHHPSVPTLPSPFPDCATPCTPRTNNQFPSPSLAYPQLAPSLAHPLLGQRAPHSLYNISLVRTLSIRGILCCGCPERLCNNPPSFVPSYTCVYSSVRRSIPCIPFLFFSFLQLTTVHPSPTTHPFTHCLVHYLD